MACRNKSSKNYSCSKNSLLKNGMEKKKPTRYNMQKLLRFVNMVRNQMRQ